MTAVNQQASDALTRQRVLIKKATVRQSEEPSKAAIVLAKNEATVAGLEDQPDLTSIEPSFRTFQS